jgi:hypothetical protein
MTQEQKELFFIDLCARLPYGVKAHIKYWSNLGQKYYEGVYTVKSVYPSLNEIYGSTEKCGVEVILGYSDYFIRPYLFPLSSMTEEEEKEYKKICELDTEILVNHPMNGEPFPALYNSQDWLNKKMFDYRGLIEKGLAIDASGLNIY